MELILAYLVLLVALVNIVYLSGIVWRVEKRLDISYKFMLAAGIVFASGTVIDIFVENGNIIDTISSPYGKLLFIVLFTIGVMEMRHLVRNLDGELKRSKKTKKKK